nr:unnamed protein product [Callosobruchus analis]
MDNDRRHHQLPPVIKNMAFQKYSNMEQSLFTRLVRLGVPTVDLDGQGRARSSICDLYRWRYNHLGNLKHVEIWKEYQLANAGFEYDFQLVDVQDFNGVGESEPSPYFYQAQIRPSSPLDYCSHVWGYAPKHCLKLLDSIQKRAVRLIGTPNLTVNLHSLEH